MYEGWTGLDTLSDVLVVQVLRPLSRGVDGRFRVWDWATSSRAGEVVVPPGEFLVVEGVGVAMRAARPFAACVVWVDAPADLRLERGIARDGEALRQEWVRWQRGEAEHFERDGTQAAAHLLVDGTASLLD